MAVDEDRARVYVEKPGQQTDNRRLPGSARPDDGYNLSCFDFQIDIAQDLVRAFLVVIGEVDTLKVNAVPERR